MASLQAFLSFLPRAPNALSRAPINACKAGYDCMCLLPVQDICSELSLVLHIKYTPHLQKKTYVSLLHRLNALSLTFRLTQGTG